MAMRGIGRQRRRCPKALKSRPYESLSAQVGMSRCGTDALERLAFETAYRAGLLCAVRIDPEKHRADFRRTAETRGGKALASTAVKAFKSGLGEASLALYRLKRP